MLQVQLIDNQLDVFRVQYVAEPEQVSKFKQETLSEIRKTAKVPGFRPQKAPNSVIELKYRKEIDLHLKSKLTQDAYHQILFETKMKPISAQLERAEIQGNKFWCDYLIFNTPKVELKQYTDLDLPNVEDDKDIDGRMEKLLGDLRQKFAEYQPYTDEDFIQDGDLVGLHWRLFNNKTNQILDSYEKDLYFYVVGQVDPNKKLPERAANYVSGLTMGEERLTIVSEDVSFWCLLKSGQKKIPAELNDELAKKSGVEDYSKLLELVRGLALKQLEEEKQQKLVNSLIEKLLEVNKINLPEWFVRIELQKLSQIPGIQQENLFQITNVQARVKLLFEAIREQEPELEFSSMELMNILNSHLMSLGSSQEEVKKIISNLEQQKKLSEVLLDLKEKLTINWLLSKNFK